MQGNRCCVVTGIGIISPLGNSTESTWQNLLEGVSGAGRIGQFDATSWPTNFACEVKNFELHDPKLDPEMRAYLNRPSEFGLGAALEAMKAAGLEGESYAGRLGISVGAGIGAISPHRLATLLSGMSLEEGLPELAGRVAKNPNSKLVLQNHPGTLAGVLASRFGATGPVTTIHTACASSGQSLGQAFLQVKRGDADVVLAGGADSLAGELLLAGFCLIGALSKRNDAPSEASRPFDKDRDGFVASEGAAFLVIEELEHARARGANIICEVAGYGETESAYRITDLPPNGRGVVEAMHQAVSMAGAAYEDVGYVNAHGTSTELNDRIEALAIRRVFGSRGAKPAISSTKSMTGHLISAAGALEGAVSALSIQRGACPPTINLHQTDCGDDLDFIANQAREGKVRYAMSNSIGFGGSNSSLLFKSFD